MKWSVAMVVTGLMAMGCSDGEAECGPAPRATGAAVEFTRNDGAPGPTIGKPQSVSVRYIVEWTGGELHPQNIGEPCVIEASGPEVISDFDVTEAGCQDDACEVLGVSEVLYQQYREIRVSLSQPTATLRVRVARAAGGFRPEVPPAEGAIDLAASP